MSRTMMAVLLSLVSVVVLFARDNRKLLWNLDLRKVTGSETRTGFQPEPVWALSFSPDESKLAVGFGEHQDPVVPPYSVTLGHLVIIAVDHPEVPIQKFEVSSSLPLARNRFLAWSPSGSSLMVNDNRPIVLHLSGSPNCIFSSDFKFGGWLSNDYSIAYRRGELRLVTENPRPTEVRLYRPDCSVADTWTVNDAAVVIDSCPTSSLIALGSWPDVSRLGGSNGKEEITIISYPKRQVIRQWIRETMSLSSGERFVMRCQDFCMANSVQDRTGQDGACWSVPQGTKISENFGFALSGSVDPEGIAGAGGAELLLKDYKVTCHEGGFWQFFDIEGCSEHLLRYTLWNITAGRQIDSWGPHFQKIENYTTMMDHTTKSISFAAALSPSAKYMAEGGSGTVQLYSLAE
jgi:hypothetical protein